MKKIAIISDIHGNFEALKEVLNDIDMHGIKEIYCLGDVVGYFTQVNECCDELRKRDIPCLMGNHDWYMASGGFCPRSNSVNDCLVYLKKVIRKDNIEWLRTFPVQRFIYDLHLVHGGWSDPIDEYIREPFGDYFSRLNGKKFVSGHTHVQSIHFFGDKTYCNPGSVGQPRDGDPRAAFVTYDGTFELHRVAYDMKVVFDLMDQAGFSDYYYGSLLTGERNLCKLPSSYIKS